MSHGLVALLPAVVTIVVALIWRRVSVALGGGVLTGALLLGGGHPYRVLKALVTALKATFGDLERIKIVLFILLVGGLLEVLAVSGAYHALADALGRWLSTARRTRMATWGLSVCLFFDDYANVLVSGSSMRGLARRAGVRPALMAYLVDVVAVLASVMLISTWAAFEGATLAREAEAIGIHRTMAELFLASLPYHFYTYLAVFLTLLVAWSGRWFGARLDHHGFLDMEQATTQGVGARPAHVVVPLGILVGGAFLGMLSVGTIRVVHAGQPLSWMGVLAAAPAVDVLLAATTLAMLVAVVLFKRDGVLGRATVRPAFARGVRDMLEIGIIVLLATTLSHLTGSLGAGPVLAGLLTQALPPAMVPLAVFTLAMLVTVATGFSWGAMAIVMPVAFALASQLDPGRLIPILSAAVITGAVSGEHLIPYSEKAVLSATACGIPPVYHFKTHVLQSVAAFLAAGVGFLCVGFGWSVAWALLLPGGMLALSHHLWAQASTSKL